MMIQVTQNVFDMNELKQDDDYYYYDESSELLAYEIRDDIDFIVLTDTLCCLSGWTKVITNPMTTRQSEEMDRWVELNCKHQYKTRGLVWVFENEQDASFFTLKWL